MAIRRETSWLTQAVSREVRALLAGAGLTQQTVSKELQRSQAYVSERLRGRAAFDLDDLDGIAQLLGMPHGIDLIYDVVRRGQLDKHAADAAVADLDARRRGKLTGARDDEDVDIAAHESPEEAGLPESDQP
jgi:transcriptional regulator with XRE-family HTH domain